MVPSRPLSRPPMALRDGKNPSEPGREIDINEVTRQADEALEAANQALNKKAPAPNTSVSSPPAAPKRTPPPPKAPAPPKVDVQVAQKAQAKKAVQMQVDEDAIAAALGGAAVGAVVGGAVLGDLQGAVDASVPPLVGAAAVGGAVFTASSQDSRVGRITARPSLEESNRSLLVSWTESRQSPER